MHARHLLLKMYQTRQPLIYHDHDFWCGDTKADPRNLSTLTAKGQIEPKTNGGSVIYTLTEKGEKAARRAASQPNNSATATATPNGNHRNGGAPTLFDSEGARIVEAAAAIMHRLDTAISLLAKIEAHAKSKSLTDTTADAQRRAIIHELSDLVALWSPEQLAKGGE